MKRTRSQYEQRIRDEKIGTIIEISLKTIGLLLVISAIIFGVVQIQNEINEFKNKCKEQGGRVENNGSVGIGTGTNGKPVVVSNPETICVDENDRIIFID
jgi:hypothetical protein